MSIATMVDTRLARKQGADPTQISPAVPVGVSTSIVNQVTRWIPTESITLYVALLALLVSGSGASPTGRWVLFAVLAAANPLIVVLLMKAKTKLGQPFDWPIFEMTLSPIAFAAWAFALPESPLALISGYEPKWGTAIITVTAVTITLIANALHRSPDFDQVVTKLQGADPASPEPSTLPAKPSAPANPQLAASPTPPARSVASLTRHFSAPRPS